MKKIPKVSIVTVCFNSHEDLVKTIKSVAEQTFSSFEYIIIDGGSSDGSKDVIIANEAIVSKWISEPDRGIYDAMNKGIDLASGEWIIFMNAGDVFYDNTVLESVFSKKIDDSIGIIYGDVELDFGKGRKVLKSFNKFDSNNVARELCHQGVLTRSVILKKIKYDLNYSIFADIDSFIKIDKLGWKLDYVPIIYATYEITNGISSTKPILSFKEHIKLYGYHKTDLKYWKCLFKHTYKYILLRILPKNTYDSIRYHRLSNRKEFQL